jgi:hypothetical protein
MSTIESDLEAGRRLVTELVANALREGRIYSLDDWNAKVLG